MPTWEPPSCAPSPSAKAVVDGDGDAAAPRSLVRRPAVVAALAIVVAMIVGVLVTQPWSHERAGDDAAGLAPATVWQHITSDFAPDGRLSAAAALQAFAYVYGVDLPGVHVPSGTDGHDRPTSASGVVRWVRGRWDDLSQPQRDAVEHTLAANPADVLVEVDLTAPPPAATSGLRRADSPPADRASAMVGDDDACARAASPLAQAVCQDVVADIGRIGPRLGMRTIHAGDTCGANPICSAILMRKVTIRLSDDEPKNVFALTQALDDGYTYSPCNITVYRSAWAGLDPTTVATTALHEILTHEVVHCYQNVIWANIPTALAIPPWITEGTALWLASDETHIEENMVGSQWRKGWLGRPSFPLFERTYDAFGWYALLDQHRWSLWDLMAGAWRMAAAAPSSPSEPFVRALDGDDMEIRAAWAPSIVRDPSRGTAWETYGFGVPMDARAPFPLIRASAAPSVGELPGRAATLTQVRATDGEVVEISTTGLAAASDGTLNLASFTSERFCTIGDCTCPTGTRLAGTVIAENNITVPFMLSFSAPGSGSSYVVTAETLDALCGAPDPLPPADAGEPGPCADRCAASNGDPHMVTVDGHRYDFQAAGEFVLLRNAGTDTEVQARQEPFPGSAVASVNTQIAARVGAHRVSVGIASSVLEVRVDGQVVLPGSTVDLGPGTHLTWGPDSIELGLPDGTTLWALGRDAYGIVLQIAPSAALRRDARGLLGTVAPGGAGLPALRDGTQLPRPFDAHERFEDRSVRLADAWRVEAASSLLDYTDSRTTADYTRSEFPQESAPSGLVELGDSEVAAAMTTCGDIADAVLWGQCVYDVAFTADGGFAALYAAAQLLIDQGTTTAGASPTPSPDTTPAAPGSTIDGPMRPVIDHVLAVDGSALADDGTLYASVQLHGDAFQLVAIDTSSSTIVQRVDTDGGGRVVMAGGSVWLGDATLAGDCAVVRFDAHTLAETGRLTAPCWLGGVQLAPLADAVWYLDVTGVTADATGAHLARIDAATLAPGARVEVPTSNGYLTASRSAIFYGDDDHGIFRLLDGESMLRLLDGVQPGRHLPAGDAIWQEVDQTAQRLDGHGEAGLALTIDGTLVGVDDGALYVELPDLVDATPQLWSYPLAGTTPFVIAAGPTIGTGAEARSLTYADGDPFLTVPGLIVKLWTVHPSAGGGDGAMFVQAIRP